MFKHPNRTYYSNIKTKGLKNSITLNPSMIFKKEIVPAGNKTREELKLNVDFWKNAPKPISVIIDEAHNILNSRRGMNKSNILITEWLSLLRRVLGSSGSDYGDLILITQLSRRIDVIAREMAHKVYYFTCLFKKTCKKCGCTWSENSDMPEQLPECPVCNSYHIKKYNHILHVRVFDSVDSFDLWKQMGMTTFYKQFLVKDIEAVFPKYDTLQWENMFSQDYE